MSHEKLNQFVTFLVVPRNTVGIYLTRFILGFTILWIYLVKFNERYMLWGPNNVHNSEASIFPLFNIYYYISNYTLFNIVYIVGIITTLLFMLGYKKVFSGPAFFIMTTALYNQNPFILTGGNNILILIVFFLAFMWGDITYKEEQYSSSWTIKRHLIGLVHNLMLLASLIQICIMYFFSGMFKFDGEQWIHGTALYYVLRVTEFTLPGVSEIIYSSALLITIGTYTTLIFQIAFPFLIWFKKLKPYMFLLAVMFHALIGIIMGLTWFSVQMIAVDILFFSVNSLEPLNKKQNIIMNKLKIKSIFSRRSTLNGESTKGLL